MKFNFRTHNLESIVRISQDSLDFSFPNKNYEGIAYSTLNLILKTALKNKDLVEFLDKHKSGRGYFLIGHENESVNNEWSYYYSTNRNYTIEDFIKEEFKEECFDYGIIFCCNSKRYQQVRVPFPLAFPYGRFELFKENEFIIQDNT